MIHAGGARDFEFIYENNNIPRNEAADKLGGIPADSPLTYWVRLISDGSTLTGRTRSTATTFTPSAGPRTSPAGSTRRSARPRCPTRRRRYPVARFDWIRFNPDASGGGGGGGGGDELSPTSSTAPTLGGGWDVVRRDQQLTVSGGALNIPAQTGDLYGGATTPATWSCATRRRRPGTATAKINFQGIAAVPAGRHASCTATTTTSRSSAASPTRRGGLTRSSSSSTRTRARRATTPRTRRPTCRRTSRTTSGVRLTSDGTNVTGCVLDQRDRLDAGRAPGAAAGERQDRPVRVQQRRHRATRRPRSTRSPSR